MDKEIEYCAYKPGDEKGIIDLLTMAFPFWEKLKSPLDYWKWKYVDPSMGSYIRVAKTEDKVVGVGHAVLLNVKIGGDILIGYMSGDVATHPDFRGRGYTQKLMP